MKFDILTLFPEPLEAYLKSSIIGRAIRNKLIEVNLVNFRDYSENKHHKVDDTIYGGSPGMLLQCQPICKSLDKIYKTETKIIFLSPSGKVFNQKKASEWVHLDHLILVCGYYEGFDERIYQFYPHEKISIGDYILTNGNLSALIVLDCVTRLKDEVVHNPESVQNESFSNGLLEEAHYTKPRHFLDKGVPDVLVSGNHEKIRKWKRKSQLMTTLQHRPDLLYDRFLTNEEQQLLVQCFEEFINDHE